MQRFKRLIITFLAIAGTVSLLMGAVVLWQNRSWRMAVDVNGRVMTAGELKARGKMLLDDARENEHLIIPPSHEKEAINHYSRTALKLWIFKEVLLGDALEKKIEISAEDEKEELAKTEKRLKSKNLTLQEYFTDGALPEKIKRRDFREALIVTKYLGQVMKNRVKPPTAKEIDERLVELRRIQIARTKPGERPPFKANRKTAIDSLRMDNYDAELRKLFQELFDKAQIKCPFYPDFEIFEHVAPLRAPRSLANARNGLLDAKTKQ